jgi:hypothetical protein
LTVSEPNIQSQMVTHSGHLRLRVRATLVVVIVVVEVVAKR